ncbi:MAG: hypothetical protein A370_04936 [Clostridium sp. Maddingley MBC34-26]|nr:MAG: hypothetical protein A370_04936 [Clostridium sp. Maddingley MBC34-26]
MYQYLQDLEKYLKFGTRKIIRAFGDKMADVI